MPPTRVDTLRRDDNAALDLPLKLAVLTVVGVAGLAALLSALPSCVVPAPLAAEVVSVGGRPGDLLDRAGAARIEVRVTSKGAPVGDATVVLSGLGAAAANRSDRAGDALLLLDPAPARERLAAEGRDEGYLKVSATAHGCYQKFENDYGLRILRR
jgi:hypothetical protein